LQTSEGVIRKVRKGVQGICPNCGASGPKRETYDGALRAWNREIEPRENCVAELELARQQLCRFMSQDEPKIPETAELTRQQIVEMLQGVVREIDVHRNKIRGQLRSASDKIPLLKELQELDRIRKPLKNCITGAGGSVTPEAPQPTQPIDPLAIGRFVSQACQAFELLEGFHGRSITLTGPTFSSSGLSSEGNSSLGSSQLSAFGTSTNAVMIQIAGLTLNQRWRSTHCPSSERSIWSTTRSCLGGTEREHGWEMSYFSRSMRRPKNLKR
jgi:hypothetical protein